jgi:hypothetical protein
MSTASTLAVPTESDRANLILPDALLEDRAADVDKALRPLLDALWQSSGSSTPG